MSIGSAGNSAAGDRARKAAYGEVLVPVIEGLELGAALRWDDYNDFGSAVTPSVHVRFNPAAADWLVLRASYNEGFKAPDLTNLYSKLSQSFNDVTDQPQCESQGVAPVDCPTFQVENFAGGNPDLQAENSEAFNVGAVVTPPFVDGLSFSADYFEVDTTDRATQLRLGQTRAILRQRVIFLREPRSCEARPGPQADWADWFRSRTSLPTLQC